MSKFTERLWRDLEREHGSDLAHMSRPAGGRARYARPRLLAGTTLGLAGVGTAIVLFLSAASSPAAFAVTGNSDGTVSVVLRKIAGIKGANEKLAALGVRAKFVQVLPGCHAPLPPATLSADLKKAPGQVLIHASRQTRIDPRKIPPGRMLVIVSWATSRHVHVVKWNASVHAAPDCIAGPAPRALRLAWAMAHGCHIAAGVSAGAAIVGGPGKRWTITRKSGKATGNSGGAAGRTVVVPRQNRAVKGCPRPQSVKSPPPGTGNSGATGKSGPFTGNRGSAGNSGSTGNSGK